METFVQITSKNACDLRFTSVFHLYILRYCVHRVAVTVGARFSTIFIAAFHTFFMIELPFILVYFERCVLMFYSLFYSLFAAWII